MSEQQAANGKQASGQPEDLSLLASIILLKPYKHLQSETVLVLPAFS